MASNGSPGLADLDSEASGTVTAPIWRLVARRGLSIVALNKAGREPALYCVHSITGDVNVLGDLVRALGPEQRVYGIQVPNEKMTAAFATSIEAIAHDYVQTLIKFQPEGPIVLGGWSAGAIIALEMAQQLQALGRDLPLLVALDGAPCNTGGGLSGWDPRYVWKLMRNLPCWFKDSQEARWSWRAFVRRLGDRLAFRFRMAGPRIVNKQTLHGSKVQDLLSKTGWSTQQKSFMRALWDAQHNYVPKPYPGKVVLYEARIQPLFHLLQLSEAWIKIANLTEIVRLPGSHNSIFREPSLGLIARDLRARLAEVQMTDENQQSPA